MIKIGQANAETTLEGSVDRLLHNKLNSTIPIERVVQYIKKTASYIKTKNIII